MYFLNNMDAKMYVFEKSDGNTEEGTMDDGRRTMGQEPGMRRSMRQKKHDEPKDMKKTGSTVGLFLSYTDELVCIWILPDNSESAQ